MRKETKLQELERRISALEKDKTIVITYPPVNIYPPNGFPGGTYPHPQCTCNNLYAGITRPPCPIHGNCPPYIYQTNQ